MTTIRTQPHLSRALSVLLLLGPIACTPSGDSVDADEVGGSGAEGATDTGAESDSDSESDTETDTDTDTDTAGLEPPEAPSLSLGYASVKQFEFSWDAVADADRYDLLVRVNPSAEFTPIATDLEGTSFALTVPLFARLSAIYVLEACNTAGCTASDPVSVDPQAASAAIGYFKASNPGQGDRFGYSMAMSADGRTLAVGAMFEASQAIGVGGDRDDDSMPDSGAVYVFTRTADGQWSQEAYIKASNTGADDHFGASVALSADGNTLAVGAYDEDSNGTGVDDDQDIDTKPDSGAAYVFVRDVDRSWTQQEYIKPFDTEGGENFGHRVALSGDGDTLAVGARYENSNGSGVNPIPIPNPVTASGAVFTFRRAGGKWFEDAFIKATPVSSGGIFGTAVALDEDGSTLVVGATRSTGATLFGGVVNVFSRQPMDDWALTAVLEASNPGMGDIFGVSVAVNDAGTRLAVGAPAESSSSADNPDDESMEDSGAVYLFDADGEGGWEQRTMLKADNPAVDDYFGARISMSGAGDLLAVSLHGEDGGAPGLAGDPSDDSVAESGAAMVFTVDADGQCETLAFLKAPTPGVDDLMGGVLLSRDGQTLVARARVEDGGSAGVGGDPDDDSLPEAGAVFMY